MQVAVFFTFKRLMGFCSEQAIRIKPRLLSPSDFLCQRQLNLGIITRLWKVQKLKLLTLVTILPGTFHSSSLERYSMAYGRCGTGGGSFLHGDRTLHSIYHRHNYPWLNLLDDI